MTSEDTRIYRNSNHIPTWATSSDWENKTKQLKYPGEQDSWASFGKLGYILKSQSIPINLGGKSMRLASYSSQHTNWRLSHTKRSAEKLRIQKAMNRAMLGINLRD